MNAISLILIVLLWSSLASAQERDAGASAKPERPRSVNAPPPAATSQTPRAPTPRTFTPSETVSADAEVRFPVDI